MNRDPATIRSDLDRRRFLLTSLAGVLATPPGADAQPGRSRPESAFCCSQPATRTLLRSAKPSVTWATSKGAQSSSNLAVRTACWTASATSPPSWCESNPT
jgi:hypothetical protein